MPHLEAPKSLHVLEALELVRLLADDDCRMQVDYRPKDVGDMGTLTLIFDLEMAGSTAEIRLLHLLEDVSSRCLRIGRPGSHPPYFWNIPMEESQSSECFMIGTELNLVRIVLRYSEKEST